MQELEMSITAANVEGLVQAGVAIHPPASAKEKKVLLTLELNLKIVPPARTMLGFAIG